MTSVPPNVTATMRIEYLGSPLHVLHIDPQCLSIEQTRGRGPKATVKHVDGCDCGDLTARLATRGPVADDEEWAVVHAATYWNSGANYATRGEAEAEAERISDGAGRPGWARAVPASQAKQPPVNFPEPR